MSTSSRILGFVCFLAALCSCTPMRACVAPTREKCADGRCVATLSECEYADSRTEAALGTSCPLSSFTCDDGNCIPGGFKCDNFNDCEDGSDERACDPPQSAGRWPNLFAPIVGIVLFTVVFAVICYHCNRCARRDQAATAAAASVGQSTHNLVTIGTVADDPPPAYPGTPPPQQTIDTNAEDADAATPPPKYDDVIKMTFDRGVLSTPSPANYDSNTCGSTAWNASVTAEPAPCAGENERYISAHI